MFVKVCGVTSVADALALSRAGVDALGLNFWDGSPRRVSIEVAAEIAVAVPSGLVLVGVFVDATHEQIAAVLSKVPLATLQFHGDETRDFCSRYDRERYWKTVRLKGAHSVDEIGLYSCQRYLLDTHVPGQVGGTGRPVDLDLARKAAAQAEVLLAGGLGPDNVAAAVRAVRPWGVDVASGVEISPGRKDLYLVEAFVQQARRAAAFST